MKTLTLGDHFTIPVDACTQTFAWIGRKRSGKTYGSGKLVEQLLLAEVQVVILDTVGNWYGLRLDADGKSKGFDIPVFGGLRADLPLLPTAGAVVADVIVDTGKSVILDISQFNFSDRKRFAADFGTKLWQRKKGESEPTPIHLVLEECQLIVPQFVGKDETRMVHVYEEIVRLGGNYGIGVSMLTQRPQSVNKEVLTQAECIMAFQINGVPERKALKEWLTYEGGDVNLVNELPSLPVGTCYVWSPQWLKQFRKVTIGKKHTLDASSTPKMGQHVVRRTPAPLDLKDIEQRMAETIEQAKADDPRALRTTILRLEKALQIAKSERPEPAEPIIKEVSAISKEDMDTLSMLITSYREGSHRMTDHVDHLAAILSELQTQRPQPVRHIQKADDRGHGIRVTNHSVGDPVRQTSYSKLENSGLRRILIALAQRLQGLTKRQLGVRASLSSKSGTFSTYISRARSNKWIIGNDPFIITQEGIAVLGTFEPLPRGQALMQYWINELGNSGAARMLEELCKEYPETLSRHNLAIRVNMAAGSGTFSTYLSRLKSLELIDGGYDLRASEEFFNG